MTPSSKLLLSIQIQLSSKVQAQTSRLQEPIFSRVSLVFTPWPTCHDALTQPAITMIEPLHPISTIPPVQKNNTDLVAVLPNNVNKTSLHPTGVTYVSHDMQISVQVN